MATRALNLRLPTVQDCKSCGVCCLHMGYPPYLSDEEHWTSMPDELKRELSAYIADYDAPVAGELDGPCCWFDAETRRCKHYQHRPSVCRKFQVGGADCLGWREQLRGAIE